MKYILWPPFAVLLFAWFLIFGMLRIIWSLVWNFRLMEVREAYTNKDGEFLFGDWSWNEFFTFLLVCPYPEKKDEEDEDFMEDEYETDYEEDYFLEKMQSEQRIWELKNEMEKQTLKEE